jgi:hypothetical protein
MKPEIRAYLQKQGKKGGKTTLKKYGKAHYRKTAEHMNKVLKARREKNARQKAI